MQLDEIADQAEAQTAAAFVGIRAGALFERPEYPLVIGLGNANAGIGDGDQQVIVLAPGLQPYGAAPRGKPDGVRQQV